MNGYRVRNQRPFSRESRLKPRACGRSGKGSRHSRRHSLRGLGVCRSRPLALRSLARKAESKAYHTRAFPQHIRAPKDVTCVKLRLNFGKCLEADGLIHGECPPLSGPRAVTAAQRRALSVTVRSTSRCPLFLASDLSG